MRTCSPTCGPQFGPTIATPRLTLRLPSEDEIAALAVLAVGRRWRKSRRSTSNGNCVEIADNLAGVVAVRDSKDHGTGPILVFGAGAWSTFVADAKGGRFDNI